MRVAVLPTLEAFDDVGMVQIQPLLDVRDDIMQLTFIQMICIRGDLAPGDVDAYLTVERLVACFELSTADQLAVAEIPTLGVCFDDLVVCRVQRHRSQRGCLLHELVGNERPEREQG